MVTRAATRFAFGDVLLVPFPFTNQAGAKQRPAVVVSSNSYGAQRSLTATDVAALRIALGQAIG